MEEPELGVGLHCHIQLLELLEFGKTTGEPAQPVAVYGQYLQVGQLQPEVFGQLLQLGMMDREFVQVVESQYALREVAQWVLVEVELFKLAQLPEAFRQPTEPFIAQTQLCFFLEALPIHNLTIIKIVACCCFYHFIF